MLMLPLTKNPASIFQDDKKTVVITLTNKAAQQEVIDLTIKGIESESGLKLEETTIEGIELFDNTIPKAVSAEVVGKYTIKVTFSEPIMVPRLDEEIDSDEDEDEDIDDFFSIDGGNTLIKEIEKLGNDTELNVTLYSALEEGTVEIEAKPAIKDYAGFGIPKKSFVLDVVEDETGPVVVDYKDAKPSEVTLIFDEEIKLTDDPGEDDGFNDGFLAKFYHTNKNNTALDLKAEGKELTITFVKDDKDNKLPEGRAYIYIEKDALQDLWENKNAKISYVVEVELDEEPPVLEKVEQDGDNAIKLTFNEDLDVESAENIENYTILKDGKEVKDIISSPVYENKVVTINFNDNLSGDYAIVVEKVKDVAGNAISKTTMSFTMKDTTPPDLDNFTAKLYNAGDEKKQMIKVSFGEAMAVSGSYSVVDLDKYVIYDGDTELINLGDWKNASIKAVDGNKAVEIKLPCDDSDAVDDKQFELDHETMTLKLVIARVADAAGNKMGALTTEVDINKQGFVDVKSVELTAKDTVVITMTDKLTTFKATDFFKRTEGTSFASALLKGGSEDPVEITRIRHTINDDGQSVITLTLAESEKTTYLYNDKDDDGNVENSSMVFVPLNKDDKTDSANAYGETINTTPVYVADKAAPVVEEVYFVELDDEYDGKEILVVFSEAIDTSTVRSNNKVSGFSVSGNKAELSEAYLLEEEITVTVGTEEEEKTIAPYTAVVLTGKNFNKYTDVSYNDAFGMDDLNGNKVKSFSRTKTLKEAKEAEEGEEGGE